MTNKTHEMGLAGLSVTSGSTAQTSIGTTPVKFTGFDTSFTYEANAESDPSEDDIVINSGGIYLVTFQISFSGSVSTEFTFGIYKNDTFTGYSCIRTLGVGGDSGSASCIGLVNTSVGDTLTIRVNADGTAKSITPVNCQLSAVKVG